MEDVYKIDLKLINNSAISFCGAFLGCIYGSIKFHKSEYENSCGFEVFQDLLGDLDDLARNFRNIVLLNNDPVNVINHFDCLETLQNLTSIYSYQESTNKVNDKLLNKITIEVIGTKNYDLEELMRYVPKFDKVTIKII